MYIFSLYLCVFVQADQLVPMKLTHSAIQITLQLANKDFPIQMSTSKHPFALLCPPAHPTTQFDTSIYQRRRVDGNKSGTDLCVRQRKGVHP